MTAKTNTLENRIIDGLLRGGALNAAGALNSSAVVTALWAATTAFSLGDIVIPPSGFTAAGGKLLLVTTAGTTGSTSTLAVPAVGSTLADGSVTFTVISVLPALPTYYVALFTSSPTETGGGTEVTGGSYARVAYNNTLANWAGTQSAGSTTASTGTSGTTSNNNTVTFPAPTANWGSVVGVALMTLPTGGAMHWYGDLTTPKTVNNGDPAPSFAAAAFSIQDDN